MARTRCILAFMACACCSADVMAQFYPAPVFFVPPPGIGFVYNGARLHIGGFLPLGGMSGFYGYPAYYPSAFINTRVIVQVNPPPIIVQRRVFVAPSVGSYDVAGIDLDVHPASKIWGEKPVIAKKAPVKKIEVAKVVPPAVKKPKFEPLPPPKAEPRPLWQRLTEDGITAFRAGEYGVALLRFRQTEADLAATRAVFLQAQACIAMGKYRAAVRLIQEGLARNPKWPTSGFQPKAELYANQDAIWRQHRQLLEQVQKDNPNGADYLFLLGYLRWFADERDIAVVYFRQARGLAADPQWADRFLKAAKN